MSMINEPPRVGAKILAFVGRASVAESTKFMMPNGGVSVFPINEDGAIQIVHGFDDRFVGASIEKTRELRRISLDQEKRGERVQPGDKAPLPPASASGAWASSSVAYTEVISCGKANGKTVARLKLLAILTGNLDAAKVGEIDAEIRFGDNSAISERPHVGAKALVLLKRDEAGKYSIPDTPVDYFPADDHGNHPAYFEVLGFDNEEVENTIENLRTLRAKDRAAMEKKEVEAAATAGHPKE
jgi:hypothetical protein